MNVKKIRIIHYWSVFLLTLAYVPLVFICIWLDRISPLWGMIILVTGIILYAINLFLIIVISRDDRILILSSKELEQKFREATDKYQKAADDYIAAKNKLIKFVLEEEKRQDDKAGSSNGTEKVG